MVIWQRLYNISSGTDKGTLFYLKVLLKRSAVPEDISSNDAAAEDFLQLVVTVHVFLAANVIHDDQHDAAVRSLANMIIDSFVNLKPCKKKENTHDDGIQEYAKELLTLGFFWHGFHDACREGDGERIMQ